ncbi:unnamed protein product [Nesidiocoris tenuis]|uniref:Pyridoxal kinase n=1 Tax=Nesidiocoris tenuis TaxID=355587 RepID=A0A6H5GNM9_9HEMI|nr:unnamed protein product [Nesidiocoris tenuis]
MATPRVLSIQSHVVRGYVGNKSATFPLQLLGFEVDAINSVQLSNHTGYKHIDGQILDEKDLDKLITSMRGNNLLHYTHLLTGYIGSPAFLSKIAEVVKELKANNPNLLYVCDPVMGDDGKMYVPQSLLPIYQETILPLADVITPNQFEMELLLGQKVESIEDAWRAIEAFHGKGCGTVLVSSSTLGAKDELIALSSKKIDGKSVRVMASIPMLDAHFTGSGDLFSALTLAWLHKTGGNTQLSLDNVIYSLQAVLKRTLNKALGKEDFKYYEASL